MRIRFVGPALCLVAAIIATQVQADTRPEVVARLKKHWEQQADTYRKQAWGE